MSDGVESQTQHAVRSWVENTMPLYQEVERIAAKYTRQVVRRTGVRRLVSEALYGMNGMSMLRHLYRRTYGEGHGPDWAALDKFRQSIDQAEFDRIDWDMLTRDLTEGMDA